MKRYPGATWKQRLLLAAVAIGTAGVLLERVTDSMVHPDAESVAQRQRTLAAQAESVYRLRELQQGDVRLADDASRAPL